ncbi:hypothetical protein [Wolbachia pipientis]|uniref:hypothetical protein n=1 Tax=Wolbachia pipientis TaxID=955 RepID=UPI0020B8885F|nr:hypothetical protein [Wolbachia pipientis]
MADSTEMFSDFTDLAKVLLRCLITFFNVFTAIKLIMKIHAEVTANAERVFKEPYASS